MDSGTSHFLERVCARNTVTEKDVTKGDRIKVKSMHFVSFNPTHSLFTREAVTELPILAPKNPDSVTPCHVLRGDRILDAPASNEVLPTFYAPTVLFDFPAVFQTIEHPLMPDAKIICMGAA